MAAWFTVIGDINVAVHSGKQNGKENQFDEETREYFLSSLQTLNNLE